VDPQKYSYRHAGAAAECVCVTLVESVVQRECP
jgi:hypothetical protein